MLEVMVGQRYGYRDHPYKTAEPLRPVEVLKLGPPKSKSKKVRVKWLDGEYEGMDEWVTQVRLVVPWDEAEPFLDDERAFLAAQTAPGRIDRESTEFRAVQEVFFALPRDIDLGYISTDYGVLTIEDFDSTARKLGLPIQEYLSEPHAFIDRSGDYTAPFSVATKLARHCCQRFPREVLLRIIPEEEAQRESVITGYYVDPHNEDHQYDVDRKKAEEFLRKTEHAFALIREWCGRDAVEEYNQVTSLREEVDRLRRLVSKAADWLEGVGQKSKATQLRKELDPGRNLNPRKRMRRAFL